VRVQSHRSALVRKGWGHSIGNKNGYRFTREPQAGAPRRHPFARVDSACCPPAKLKPAKLKLDGAVGRASGDRHLLEREVSRPKLVPRVAQANRNTAGNRQLMVPSSGVGRAGSSASLRRYVHRRRATHPSGLCSHSVPSASRRPTLRPRATEQIVDQRQCGRAPQVARASAQGLPGSDERRPDRTNSSECASQAKRNSSIRAKVYSQAGVELRRSTTKRDRSPRRSYCRNRTWRRQFMASVFRRPRHFLPRRPP
jgi:hypothetical protein